MDHLNSLSAIQSEIAGGKISCRGLVEGYLERIEKNKHLNAFLEVYSKEALEKADYIDAKIKSGQAGKLHGLVVAIKDVLVHKNHAATSSSKILKGFNSLYSATVVERLENSDAIIIGRTNCDEFAMGSSNENSAYGPVLNAADNTLVPGGSSGGSAVAVQAGLCLASLGTDTGGSIRQPASFTGTVGIKPTYGRISRWGLIAYASSFDQIGTFTTNIEDAARILEVISGADEFDSTVSTQEVPAYSNQLELRDKLRIAYYKEPLEGKGLDPEIRESMFRIIEFLKSEGHVVEPVELPWLDYMVPAYYVLTTAEASSNLSRFDGVRYGYSAKDPVDLEDHYKRTRTEGFGEEVKRRIMLGTFVLSSGYYDAYYAQGQKVRRLIRDQTRSTLANYDHIILPTTPTTAFKIGEKASDPIQLYLADIFTVQAPLCGLPAISLPLCVNSSGLPFGFQIISDKFEEAALLAFSKYLMDHRSQLSGTV